MVKLDGALKVCDPREFPPSQLLLKSELFGIIFPEMGTNTQKGIVVIYSFLLFNLHVD